MTKAEFIAALASLGNTQAEFTRQLAEQTGNFYRKQDINKWAKGRRPVPKLVAALVRQMVALKVATGSPVPRQRPPKRRTSTGSPSRSATATA